MIHPSIRGGMNKHEWELLDERCKKLHVIAFIQPSNFDFATITIMPTKKDSAKLWT
jgi:hypothetical protein